MKELQTSQQSPVKSSAVGRTLSTEPAIIPSTTTVLPTLNTDVPDWTIGEPLLEENKSRFVLFPIKHQEVWRMYKKAEASFWTTEEIDLSADTNDWNRKLNNVRKEQQILSHIFQSAI